MRMIELTRTNNVKTLINLDLVTGIIPYKDFTLLYVLDNKAIKVKEDYETIKKLIKEN